MGRVPDDVVNGIVLSRAYFAEVVEPILSSGFPGLRYAAGRLGAGSDVLGLDDEVSRDHDWGLRLSLFVPHDAVGAVRAELERRLPPAFRDHPIRFAFTGESEPRHHVEVDTAAGFFIERLGFDPRAGMDVRDWLSLSGQAVLEVVAGSMFADLAGEVAAARGVLAWYPEDIWRYVLACDWDRISQELPLMGRAADVGDEIGSRIIAARLAHVVVHLAFMLERQWPPYAKWLGTRFQQLACADSVGPAAAVVLEGSDAAAWQRGLADALGALLNRQNALGLTSVDAALVPFWDRPYLHPDPAIAAQLIDGISEIEVRELPQGRGSIEQRTDNVNVLVDPGARRRAVAS
jgi:hypothetical protein